jgi:hypothetical protein
VSGRIIHGETGKPLPNIVYGITRHFEGSANSTSGARSNTDGEFKFENIVPGKYSVYVETDHNSEIRANPVPFEVTDRDITGLVIKTVKGASLSGVAVIESSDEKTASKKLSELHVYALIENSDEYSQGNTAARLNPDGSFKLNGLRAGNAPGPSDQQMGTGVELTSVKDNGIQWSSMRGANTQQGTVFSFPR